MSDGIEACPFCGYQSSSAACPECGREATPADRRTLDPDRLRWTAIAISLLPWALWWTAAATIPWTSWASPERAARPLWLGAVAVLGLSLALNLVLIRRAVPWHHAWVRLLPNLVTTALASLTFLGAARMWCEVLAAAGC